MSYCVNCGVELDKSAKKCVLCDTPVINPRETGEPAAVAPYPDKVVLPPAVRRRYIAFLISMCILIPNIVCVIINILFPRTGDWAVYVVSTSVLAWVLFVQPFFWKKQYPYTQISIDIAAAALYIYVFYAVGNEKGWFYSVAMPLLLILEGILLFMTFWLKRKKRDWPGIVIALLIDIGLFAVCADLLLHIYLMREFALTVSLIVIPSCAALVVFFFSVKKNKRLRAWLSRKFFV